MNRTDSPDSKDRIKPISRRFLVCSILLAAVMTSACGQRGPLFLPESEPPLASESSQAESEGSENSSTGEEESGEKNRKENETTP